jgi:hypothetical protein
VNSLIQPLLHSMHSKILLSDVKNGTALNRKAFYSKIATCPFGFSSEEHSTMNELFQWSKYYETHYRVVFRPRHFLPPSFQVKDIFPGTQQSFLTSPASVCEFREFSLADFFFYGNCALHSYQLPKVTVHCTVTIGNCAKHNYPRVSRLLPTQFPKAEMAGSG